MVSFDNKFPNASTQTIFFNYGIYGNLAIFSILAILAFMAFMAI